MAIQMLQGDCLELMKDIPDDNKSPQSSTFDLKYFTVERWALTQ